MLTNEQLEHAIIHAREIGGHLLSTYQVADAAAELLADRARLAEFDALAASYGINAQQMLTLAKSQIETAKDNAALREWQRRAMEAMQRAIWQYDEGATWTPEDRAELRELIGEGD